MPDQKNVRRRDGLSAANPTAQELYTTLINEQISPFMREQGLTGSQGRYAIASETHWALIAFQKSAYSDRTDIRFTINLLVVGRDFWDARRSVDPRLPLRPTAGVFYGSAFSQSRIGSLLPDGEDRWWRVHDHAAVHEVAGDVCNALARFGIPWMVAEIARERPGVEAER